MVITTTPTPSLSYATSWGFKTGVDIYTILTLGIHLNHLRAETVSQNDLTHSVVATECQERLLSVNWTCR